MEIEERTAIANTILAQLGGGRFRMMTGAKDLTFGENGALSFKLTIGKWRHVKIELTPMDTYTVTFTNFRKYEITGTSVHEDIYAENLVGLFERETGLYTTMGRRAS